LEFRKLFAHVATDKSPPITVLTMNNNLSNMNHTRRIMPSARVSVLSKQDIAATAQSFQWNRQLPKWTVIVDGREFPARPLVLEAAGVPPNDPTNSHQAIALLKDRGFVVRYQGKDLQDEANSPDFQSATDEFIRSLRGCSKSGPSMVEAREREHRIEKIRTTHG
jgi:hypothetical protein